MDFYARRIRRTFPSLVVVLIACFAFGWFALFAGIGSKFVLVAESGYFAYGAER